MGVGKPRGKNGMRPVYVYDPAVKRKVYVGSREKLQGPDGANALFREKTEQLNGRDNAPPAGMTCGEYADRWLTVKHGEGTRRPSPTTLQVNRGYLKTFRADFADRELDGGVTRLEALDWSRTRRAAAKTVSAMFNDAVDDMLAEANPFGNRRQPEGRGRRDIAPLTEQEIDKLAEIAVDAHNAYGLIVAGWIVFLAWVGCRPGEAFTADWADLDLLAGRMTVHRIKGDKQTQTIVIPPRAIQAILAMPVAHHGPLFRTVQGRRYDKGATGYYWRPIRTAFIAQLETARRRELQAVKGALDVYALRHFCGSLMADRGLTEFDIAHQLGNSPEVCRQTYIHTHVDRANDRIALALAPNVADLDARRRTKKGA